MLRQQLQQTRDQGSVLTYPSGVLGGGPGVQAFYFSREYYVDGFSWDLKTVVFL